MGLMEFFSIADQASAADVIQQLSGPLLVQMIHTKDGSRIGMLCIKHGSAKERKKIVKGLKGHVSKIARDRFGSMNGRRPLLQLLHPNCSRYFSPDDLASLDLSIPSLCTKGDREINFELDEKTKSSEVDEAAEEDKSSTEDITANISPSVNETLNLSEGGKKDSFLRRRELLVNSGLAESLIACCEEVGELLGSNFGKEVIYEVATGDAGGILQPD